MADERPIEISSDSEEESALGSDGESVWISSDSDSSIEISSDSEPSDVEELEELLEPVARRVEHPTGRLEAALQELDRLMFPSRFERAIHLPPALVGRTSRFLRRTREQRVGQYRDRRPIIRRPPPRIEYRIQRHPNGDYLIQQRIARR